YFVLVVFKIVVGIEGDFVAVRSLGEAFDGADTDGPTAAIDALQGELQTIEEGGCALAVDGFVDEGAQDAGDGELDGAAIFEEGDVKGIDQADGLFGGPVELRVEIAE